MEYQKQLTNILGFDFYIQYKPGLENKAADALSRRDFLPQLVSLSISLVIQLEEIETAVDQDEILRKIKEEFLQGSTAHPYFSMVRGRLLRQGKLVLPQSSPLNIEILKEFQDSQMGGYGGILKSHKQIGALLYWKGMMSDIKKYVAICQVCQHH